jgi:hypothetical protein
VVAGEGLMSGSGSGRNLGIEAGWAILGSTSSFAITVVDLTTLAKKDMAKVCKCASIAQGDKGGYVVADGRVNNSVGLLVQQPTRPDSVVRSCCSVRRGPLIAKFPRLPRQKINKSFTSV